MIPGSRFIHAALISFLALGHSARFASATQHAGQASGTWRAADSPHFVLSDTLVGPGDNLVIEPGCTVYFAAGASLVVAGRLDAPATEQSPTWMLSSELPPSPGDWDGIEVRTGATALLSWVGIRHAVTGVAGRAGSTVAMSDAGVTECSRDGAAFDAGATGSIARSAFTYNGEAGVRLDGAAMTVSTSDFYGNERAVSLRADCFPTLRLLTAGGHTGFNGVVVDTSASVSAQGAWANAGIPYVVEPNETLAIDDGATLLLDPGVVLKLGAGATVATSGGFGMLGMVEQPCAVTALADDSLGGDTNADGASTAPQKGDWNAIEVLGTGAAYLSRTEVLYGVDGVRVYPGGQASLLECELHHCRNRAAAFGIDTAAVVRGCSFHDNDTAVQVQDPAGIAMGLPPGAAETGGGNVFTCNGLLDVENLNVTTLPALGNFWGSAPPDGSMIAGPVDVGSYLIDEPTAGPLPRLLMVERSGASDLLFRWRETSSCATYRLSSAPDAGGPFSMVGTGTTAEAHLLAGAVTSGPALEFYELDLAF